MSAKALGIGVIVDFNLNSSTCTEAKAFASTLQMAWLELRGALLAVRTWKAPIGGRTQLASHAFLQ